MEMSKESAGRQHESILSKLATTPGFHQLITATHAHEIGARILKRWPVVRKTKRLGLRYRVRSLESFLVADEIFRREVYALAFQGANAKTFIDVGANVGYFPCFAADFTEARDILGLAIDVAPGILTEVRWHVETNQLCNVHVIEGLVGYPPDVKRAPFYIAGSNVSGSAQPNFNPRLPLKGNVQKVDVACIDLFEEWKRVAGDQRVNVLKMDIEGFELPALRNLGSLLEVTDRVVLEWHKWITSKDEIAAELSARGFHLHAIADDSLDAGIGVFAR
jgi:FkbM family methyltransferase